MNLHPCDEGIEAGWSIPFLHLRSPGSYFYLCKISLSCTSMYKKSHTHHVQDKPHTHTQITPQHRHQTTPIWWRDRCWLKHTLFSLEITWFLFLSVQDIFILYLRVQDKPHTHILYLDTGIKLHPFDEEIEAGWSIPFLHLRSPGSYFYLCKI